jgi:two-component system LytT family response regulator
MIRTLLIDDEPQCIQRIADLFDTDSYHDINIIEACHSVESATQAIYRHRPDLLLLDVEIGRETGFQLLEKFPKPGFGVIFTTAYNQYAVQAFRSSAIDFLLKPIEAQELLQAIEKFRDKKSFEHISDKLDNLLRNLKVQQPSLKRICIPMSSGIEFIQVNDIIRCESSGNYTNVYIRNKPKIFVAKTLKEFDEMLVDCDFFRVHHSHLINLQFVKNYQRGKGGSLTLHDGTEIEVSVRRKDEFLKKMMQVD